MALAHHKGLALKLAATHTVLWFKLWTLLENVQYYTSQLVALWKCQWTDQSFEAMMVVSYCDSPDQVETGRRKPSQIRGLLQKRPFWIFLENGVRKKLELTGV